MTSPAEQPPASPPAGPAVEYLAPVQASDFPEVWYEDSRADNFWFQWRLRVLRRSLERLGLPLGAAWHALDIGCGAGVTKLQLAQFTGWTVDGADLNRAALLANPPLPGRLLYYDIMARHPEFCGHYDAALLLDVIEHIEPTRPFLAAALDHLRPGGVLIVNVPALHSLFSRYDEVAGHHRRYTAASLRAEFAGLPVDCLHVQYWGLTLVPLGWLRKPLVRRIKDPAAVIRRGFTPPSPVAHALLRTMMRVETTVLPVPPVGSSLLAVLRKHA